MSMTEEQALSVVNQLMAERQAIGYLGEVLQAVVDGKQRLQTIQAEVADHEAKAQASHKHLDEVEAEHASRLHALQDRMAVYEAQFAQQRTSIDEEVARRQRGLEQWKENARQEEQAHIEAIAKLSAQISDKQREYHNLLAEIEQVHRQRAELVRVMGGVI